MLDHSMPGRTGMEILEGLGPDSDTLAIMVTAYASLEMAVRATKTGAFDFLAKPFTPNELREGGDPRPRDTCWAPASRAGSRPRSTACDSSSSPCWPTN